MQQPQYMPYIGFFHKLMLSDTCVILDDVQYSKNDFFNRNKIKTAQGWCWLTIPVVAKNTTLIKDVKINNSMSWREKHFKSILSNYKKAPFFDEHINFFESLYKKEWSDLTDLNMGIINYICEQLEISIKFIRSSSLGVLSTKTERLIDICKKLDADTYISGTGAKNYMKDELFKENKIELFYQDFEHPIYDQRFGDFEQFMSAIDLLFNKGHKSIEIIKNSGRGS